MFVVTKGGKRLQVDDSSFEEDEYVLPISTVGMFHDGLRLRKVWILEICNNESLTSDLKFDILSSRCFNHYPTEDEILYRMSAEGVGYNGYAFVEEAYVLDDEDV